MPNDKWQWKSVGGASGKLLYEPGNWGDIIKAEWLLLVVKYLTRNVSSAISVSDLFAGAPHYPLSRATVKRISQAGSELLSCALAPFTDNDLWPSASGLILDIVSEGGGSISVFDLEHERRKLWESIGNVSVFDAECGWDVLSGNTIENSDLLIIDPYDYLADWRRVTARVVAISATASVMVYIYNRSAKGAERLRDYRDFRNCLDDFLGDRLRIIGRVPADSFLPNAHHEMLFIPSEKVAGSDGYDDLEDSLAVCAARIADVIRLGAVVER